MEISYRPEVIEQVNRSFDSIVSKIKEKDFRIVHNTRATDLQML